jgi:hypothetical protein
MYPFQQSSTDSNFKSGQYFFIARVTSVILGSWDPEYTRESDLGTIKYQLLYSPLGKRKTRKISNSGNKPAYPMSGFIKNYPLVNEIVLIVSGPSDTMNDNYSNKKLFYFSPYNLWNDSNHNAFPDLENYADYLNNYTNNPDYSGRETPAPEYKLGFTFKEKYVRNLQPFEGDVILQSRFGQSIRFGSTVEQLKNSNTWSQFGPNGDPITIISNQQGQRAESTKFETLVEDINRDGSSIYLTSTQQINIEGLSNFPLNSFGVQINPSVQNIIEAAVPFPVSNSHISAAEQDELSTSNTTQ